ncbi:cupin domain-containing protein [Roseomonas elaeocarpi]|uniref:Cupin domain-containing protein n=1 Tax=Roseomonas elaeocarpi TaxID=907779 RepID=A0ABV6JNL8_9PROT
MTEPTAAAAPRNHVSLPGAGRVEAVLGTVATYKAEASETGGHLVCAEITVPPGQGIPPHRHTQEDESFYVLAGRVVIEGDDCGGGVALGTGGFFYGPRGHVHGFRCEGEETARLLVLVSPGTGIGAMFTELAGLTAAGQEGGVDPAHIAAVCGRYGIAFGPG